MQKLHRLVPPRRRKAFQRFIFSWWKTHRRDLPWRHTHDPYRILVSEVMLQQTQVSRVLPKYNEFLKKFPTLKHLRSASVADVLKAWKGLGYNRRALYLKKIRIIPNDEKELMKLPGIGKYTARAICVFAYKQDIAMVDTNIRQIITHFFFNDKPQKENIIEKIADTLVPKGKSWEWHQALMDYGALKMDHMPGLVKKQSRFKDSKRFYRGKLVDILRNGPVKERTILNDFSHAIITSLLKDGLIVKRNGVISLPT